MRDSLLVSPLPSMVPCVTYTILPATPQDLDELADVYATAMQRVEIQGIKEKGETYPEPDKLYNVLNYFFDKKLGLMVKALDKTGAIKGFAGGSFEHGLNRYFSLMHLYTREEGKGAGKTLLTHWKETASETGLHHIDVMPRRDAIDFYTKNGFKPIPSREPFAMPRLRYLTAKTR